MPGVGEEKVAIITGASTGIGLATVEGMARSGRYRKIVLAGRDAQKHDAAMAELRLSLDPALKVELEHAPLDLGSLKSVREFAQSFTASGQPLDTLVLNAGVMALPERQMTDDGYEYQFGVNHLGHFLLANLLIDVMSRSGASADPARVIALSSSAHAVPSALARGDLGDLQSMDYQPWVAYGQSKLANVLFAYELDRRCRERGLPVSANAVHPGVVDSELARYLVPDVGELGKQLQSLAKPVVSYVLKSVEEGAKTSVLLATQKEGKLSGRYWQEERPAASVDIDPLGEFPALLQALIPEPVKPKVTSYDPETWASLWRVSETLVGLQPGEASSIAEP